MRAPAATRLADDDDVDEVADPSRQRGLAAGDVRRREPAEDERQAAEQQRAAPAAHATRRATGSSRPMRAPRARRRRDEPPAVATGDLGGDREAAAAPAAPARGRGG